MITSGQVCATKTKQNKTSNCIEIVWTFETKIYFTLITVSVQSVLIGSWKFIGFEAVWKACDKSPTMQWNRIDIRAAGFLLFCLFFFGLVLKKTSRSGCDCVKWVAYQTKTPVIQREEMILDETLVFVVTLLFNCASVNKRISFKRNLI